MARCLFGTVAPDLRNVTMKTAVTFEGRPCPKGCGTTRYTKGGRCIKCAKQAARSFALENPAKHRAAVKKAVANNPKIARKAYYSAAIKLARKLAEATGEQNEVVEIFISSLFCVPYVEVVDDISN